MGEILDSDWSRPNLLRSDWLGLIGAIMTTVVLFVVSQCIEAISKWHLIILEKIEIKDR